MKAVSNFRQMTSPSPVLRSTRRGFVFRGFESALIVSVAAAVIAVALYARSREHDVDGTGSNADRTISRIVAPTDGQRLFIQCGTSEICRLDLQTRSVKRLLKSPGVCFWECSSDGRTMFTSSRQQHFTITVEDEVVVDEHFDSAQSMLCGMSPDGAIAATIRAGTQVRCWDLTTGSSTEFELRASAENFVVDSHHRRLYVNSADSRLEAYDIEEGGRPESFSMTMTASKLSLSNDQQWLIASQGTSVTAYKMDPFRLQWDWQSDKWITSLFSMSPDSKSIAIARVDGQLLVKDLATGKTTYEHFSQDWSTSSVSFLPGNDTLVLGKSNGSLVFWPLHEGPAKPICYFVRDEQ